MVPQHDMQPSIARDSGQVDLRHSMTDIPPPQSAILGLHLIAHRLLLINRPRRDGTLSWCWYTAAKGVLRRGTISSCQSAATSKIVKHCCSRVFSCKYGTVWLYCADVPLRKVLTHSRRSRTHDLAIASPAPYHLATAYHVGFALISYRSFRRLTSQPRSWWVLNTQSS